MGTTNKNSCKTAAVMNLLGKGPAVVQEVRPVPDRPRDIETITREFLEAKRTAGEAFITMGQRLMEIKARLSHGEWLSWLAERAEFSESSAQKYMKLAREYSNPESIRDLGYTKALILLALPDGEREAFIETPHLVNGEEKMVTDMSQRELKAAIKARDEALKAAEQAEADRRTADAAREKLSQDMKMANQRIEGLNAEVAEHSAKAREAQEAAARLEKALAELRSRPVEVAVERDEAAIEAARKEAEAAMQARLSKAWEAQSKAEKAQEAAEKARAKAQRDLEQAKAEAQALREQAARNEKKAALTSDADLILFDELFTQTQTNVNRMGGVVLKKREKEPEAAGKLAQALLALCEKIKGVAQG